MWWSAITSVVKGFFESIWNAWRQRGIDKEKAHTAALEVESKEFDEYKKSKEKADKVRKENSPDRDLDDILDGFK